MTATTAALSRRGLLRAAGVGAAVAGLGGAGSALVAAPASAATSPLPPSAFLPTSQDLHLLRRATFGPTPGLVSAVAAAGRTAWLERQLHPSTIDDSACDQLVASRWPNAGLSVTQARIGLSPFSWDGMHDLGQATVVRALWSKRQLFEVMVDFWSNHLNVTNPFDGGWDCRPAYDRFVIRRYALGRFRDMLVASAKHPAMLRYLNNAESTKDSPNENYGRELLELHTVGVDAGYTEPDMHRSALVMTGFGIDEASGLFSFHPNLHYTGPVKVMGWSSPNATPEGGYAVAVSYLTYLARHPATARHIATKLYTRFVGDTPSSTTVSALASTYLANDTAIVPVLRQLFASAAFTGSVGKKVRRPFEDLAATVRVLGIQPDASGTDGVQGLYWMADDLGQVPLGWHPPDGYPDVASSWRSSGGTLGRWNMHLGLAAHWWPDTLRLPPLRNLLPATLPATYGGYVDALAKRLVFRPLATQHRAAVLGFLGKSATTPLGPTDEALGWRLPYVVALVLDSPYHWLR